MHDTATPTKPVVEFVHKVTVAKKPITRSQEEDFYHTMFPKEQPRQRPKVDISSFAKLAKVHIPSTSKINLYTNQLNIPTSPSSTCPNNRALRPRTTPHLPSPRERQTYLKEAKPLKPPVVDTTTREHLEIKACMLAHAYGIDINELEASRGTLNHINDSNRIALQNEMYQEACRRKTQFLLDHFFCFDHQTPHVSAEDKILYEVIQEWALNHNSTQKDVSNFWDSVNAHLEESYILKSTVLTDNKPNRLTTLIALDCLGKLADSLPSHSRLISVIKCVLERGLFFPSTDLSTKNQKLYFDHAKELEETINQHTASLKSFKEFDASPPMHKISKTIAGISNDKERHDTLLQIVSNHLPQTKFGMTYLREAVVSAAFDDQLDLLNAMICQRVNFEVQAFVGVLHTAQPRALSTFINENDTVLDSIMMIDNGNSIQRFMERQANGMAQLFLKTISTLNGIIQTSPQELLGQFVEHNRLLIAQYLAQKHDTLLQLMSIALKDNNLALEDYLVKTPKALRDIALNRPMLLASIVKSTPTILTDILVHAKPTFGKIMTEDLVHLTHICITYPSIIASILNTNENLFAILSGCTQALSTYLEKNPEAIMEIAHRRPGILTGLFASFPDLIVEPLEANPTLISSILMTNQQLMRSIRFEDLESAPIQFRKVASDATQTDVLLPAQNVAGVKMKKRYNILSNIVKKRKVNPMEKSEVFREIAKLYVNKIQSDEVDDQNGLDRVTLAEATQDIYIQELGLKSTSQKRIASLVAGVKKFEKECTRVKWFGVLLGATPELYNAQAIDVFLRALQLLLPTVDMERRLADASQVCWIPQHNMEHVATQAFDIYTPPDVFSQLQQRLLTLPSVCERRNKRLSKVTAGDDLHHVYYNLDDIMDCVMSVWYEYQTRVNDELTVLFAQADGDGNGVLTYREFETMIKKIDPTCDDRTIMRIFNMCGEENDQGEHEIKPGDFATVMRTYHASSSKDSNA
ncbi:hypothetical protein THRCLA_01184 [Thraustotheca clavata]|uniref:EF-hand domain-containing protein n=1 Tax=Thraustotheca clavata TaxID=74557 RepID=A0A1W0A910_9STRA|nr:hypothetical protein THRCLA_01184 [Thraustotheca clavata]